MKLERYSVCARAGEHEHAAQIATAIEAVSDPKLRRILRLRYLDGKTWVMIGHILGLTEAAARHYARRNVASYGLAL